MMESKLYWKTVIELEFDGKIKKEEYLVVAETPTDVEAKMVKHFDGTVNFEIFNVTKTKILDVIT